MRPSQLHIHLPILFVVCSLLPAALDAQAQPSPSDAPPPPAQAPQSQTEPAPAAPSTELEATPKPDVAPQLSPTDPFPPTGVEEELDLLQPGIALKRKLDKLAEKTNLRIGIANTLLFQQASGGPGERSAGGGDLDLYAKWTAIGAGTKDTGILAFAGEYRYQIGDQAPAALGGQIGTLIPTTNGFNERPPIVKETYWDQRLFEDRFRFAIGRIDPENLFGGHRLQSANTFFLYKAFSSNVTVAYPGPGPAAVAQVKPIPWLYATAGITDANGKATTMDVEGFFENHEYLTFGEGGVTPEIEGVGTGRYRLAIWHIDARTQANKPSDDGFTISCDQDFGKSITAFARYGYAEGDVTGVTNSVQGGVGIKAVLAQEDMLGIAVAWSEPYNAGLRDEKVLEVFERFQITDFIQLTLDAELIVDPSNAPGDDTLGVFSARFRVAF